MNAARVRFARAVIERVRFQSYRRAFFAEFGVVFLAFAIQNQSRFACFGGGQTVKQIRLVIVCPRQKRHDITFFAFENFCRIIGFLIAVEIARYDTFSVAAITWSRRYFPAAIIFVEIAFDFCRQSLRLCEICKVQNQNKNYGEFFNHF